MAMAACPPRSSRGIVRWWSIVAVAMAISLAGCSPSGEPEPPEDGEDEPATPEPEPQQHLLTGEETEEVPDRPALLIKVSNSPEARPHTGLEAADVVFEELTEGGVTRFLAVFHSELPEVVGPIRSARPVDIQLLSGFERPGFAYSGARGEVRALLADAPAATITEGAPGFFRDDGTYASHPFAPHDLFIETEPALEAVVDGGASSLADLGWVFDPEPPAGGETDGGAELEVAMSPSFRTGWTYDEVEGVYRRLQNGEPSRVTGPDRIGAANVAVLDVRHYTGDSGYPETDVLGEGEALVLRDGRRYPARWSKPTATDPLLVLTADGSETFPLRPGPTWILLPDELPAPPEEPDES
ncbi:MAG: DUF3048 domain-containing protein [Nitriliruptor sp.]|nr:MAG: DUF3048 domain-containing protein [Nitriliruptor sp.]TVR17575.1 MAG: DUF3048 domain-containing protein [Nitriliruptor sp.]